MKKKIIVIVTLLCVAILCVGSLVVSLINKRASKNASDAVGNTAGNLYNKGYFCESDNGYVYFANAYDGFALYRMLPDESEMKKLITTETKSINAAGKYFYYYQSGSGAGTGLGYLFRTTGIYRADAKNGNNAICLNMLLSDEMILTGNTIYYYATSDEGDTISKMDIDGKNKQVVLPYKISLGSVQNGNLYYTDGVEDFHLKALNLSSNSISEILAEDVYQPIVDGNEVYCIDIHNNYALVRYDLTTKEKTVLDESRTDLFNLSDRYVYYQTSGDNPQLKRVSRDGATIEVIADGAYSDINLTSRYVYFHKFDSDVPVYKIPLDGSLTISTFDVAKEAAFSSAK